MSAILKMLEAADKAMPGPWRIKPLYNLDDKDRTKILETIYEVCAGARKGPFENKGWFHPDDAEYYEDELAVVSSEYTEACDHVASISKEDAEFVIVARNATADIQRLVSWVESAGHRENCDGYYETPPKCSCGWTEIHKLIRS